VWEVYRPEHEQLNMGNKMKVAGGFLQYCKEIANGDEPERKWKKASTTHG
jgi:hypothetical protein